MKFHITDENGEITEVEELEEEKKTEDEEPEIILSTEEIIALKSLIPHIEDIKALLIKKEEKEEDIEDKDEEEKEEIEEDIDEEDDEIEEDNDEEEIIDTDEEREDKIHDSIGSIGKKNAHANDALDAQEEIVNAWAKRYNGGTK